MMRRSLYHIKWYFAKTDLNTDKGKAENKKSIVKYVKWYTPEKEKQYPTSFKVDFEGQPHEGACYYRITRCPICAYAEKAGRFRVDAAVLRVGRVDDHTPARRSAQETDAGEWRRVLRLLYYRQQRTTLNPTSVSSVMPESESKVLLHDSFAWSCTIPCSRDKLRIKLS